MPKNSPQTNFCNMNSYKYTLEKYNSSGSGQPRNRYTCPSCKRTRCFTRYVDTATGTVLDPSVGKCDHENRCGYHYTPAQFFRDHPSRRPDGQAPQETRPEQPPQPPTPPSTIDWSYLGGSHSPRSGFVGWLARRPSRPACEPTGNAPNSVARRPASRCPSFFKPLPIVFQAHGRRPTTPRPSFSKPIGPTQTTETYKK